MWFKAARGGNYEGQCAEFCGLGHATMTITVKVARVDEEFDQMMETGLMATQSHPVPTAGRRGARTAAAFARG